MRCIYCMSEILKENASEEHVFPKAFGCPERWYIECVCKDCNVKLGETIDRVLASDSLMGLWRLKRIGSRSKKHVNQKRTKINLPDNEKYGVYAGAIIYVDFTAIDTIIMPNQIVIKDKSGQRRFFLVDDLEEPETKKEILKYKAKNLRILSQDEDGKKIAIKKLAKIDINFNPLQEGNFPKSAKGKNNKIKVITQCIMDESIYRAIAKINLNYLAKIQGYQFVLNSNFNAIRKYIRYDEKTSIDFVNLIKGRILVDETINSPGFDGHIFVVYNKGKDIISKVSLFNYLSLYFEVKLGHLSIIPYDLKSGHGFSLKEKELIELIGGRGKPNLVT